MEIEIFEYEMAGNIWIEFEIHQSWENFLFIADIIENHIGAKSIEKIETIAYTYEKDNFQFELAYPLSEGISLKLLDGRNHSEDLQNNEKLRNIAKEIVDFFQENVPKLDKEIKLNKFIKLQLRKGITYIFIDNKLFKHCLGLYLIVPIPTKEQKKIKSIAEANEIFNIQQAGIKTQEIEISPEEEFMGHCSNLQAWVENNYDTRLIHYNLAFPLLKKLTEAGDPQAKKIFKEEIAKRYNSGFPSVVKYLEEEGYLEYLSKEELEALK
ncbi:MAG: hypothetical protein ACFFD7_00845 [Candidatus Thorarchaeota archaeon]